MRSSLTSPNDVFILRGLQRVEEDLQSERSVVYEGQAEQITRFSEDALKGKNLAKGDDFWFKGAENKDVHGWILKPKGWKKGEKKKWPVLLLIHGGKFSSYIECASKAKWYFQGPKAPGKTNGQPAGILIFLLSRAILRLLSIRQVRRLLVKVRPASVQLHILFGSDIILVQILPTPLQRIGVGNHSSICERDGNMSWISILRSGSPALLLLLADSDNLNID